MTPDLFKIEPSSDPLDAARKRLADAESEYKASCEEPLTIMQYYISSARYEEVEDARESLAQLERERLNNQ